MMRHSYKILLTLIFAGVTALLSGCSGGGVSSSVYGGYGYPHYGYDMGYNSVYYDDDDFDSRHERVGQRRENRAERINDMPPDQRRNAQERLQQTRPQRVQQRQNARANRPARNMGRPRGMGRRR